MPKERLEPRKRRVVMKWYLDGVLSAREAATMIGVTWLTVHRLTPEAFDWKRARAHYLARRLRALELRHPDI